MFDVKLRTIKGFDYVKRSKESVCEVKHKYSNETWDANNKQKLMITQNNTILSKKLTEQSQHVIDEVNEVTQSWQREVKHQISERMEEIKFLTEELEKQRKIAKIEEEALTTYRDRILAVTKKIEKGLEIDCECMRLRNCRGGIDLCDDEVEAQLKQELKIIKGCEQMIQRALEEINNQLKRLRSAFYSLDKDIEDKNAALKFDAQNLALRETSETLRPEFDASRLHCIYSLDEWQQRTSKNIIDNAKELTSATNIRAYIDILLKQICEDLQNQTDRTNDAFRRRIRETREIKRVLEEKHRECTTEVINIEKNIFKLQQELNDRERSMALCQTRLGNRSRRLDIENTCDLAQQALLQEFHHLKINIDKLQRTIAENKAMLRYMTFTVTMQQEEINIKTNTLKIDEVECLIMRMGLNYSP